MAIIAWAFDAMRRYYRSMGRQQAEYVRMYMDEGTLIRVNGEEGQQYIPLVRDKLSGTYDVIVDEAPTSVNQRERTWAVLETLIPQVLQAGLTMPKEILDYAPIPADLAEKWKQALQPDPEKQQLNDATVKATLDKLVAEVKKLEAGAQLDTAKAQEIISELGRPGEDPNAQMQMELFKTKLEGEIEARITKLKTDRESETKLMVEQMKIDSAERIAQMEAAIDARLEQSKMHTETTLERQRMAHESSLAREKASTEASTKRDVAKIGAEAKGEDKKEDASKLIMEAIGELQAAVGALSSKKTGMKFKRDKDGNITGVETADGRKIKVKRDKSGNMSELAED